MFPWNILIAAKSDQLQSERISLFLRVFCPLSSEADERNVQRLVKDQWNYRCQLKFNFCSIEMNCIYYCLWLHPSMQTKIIGATSTSHLGLPINIR